PPPRADIAVALSDTAGRGHKQGEREIRGRLGQDARCVANRDPTPGARRDVDVVEADRVVADHAELRTGRVEQLVVDTVGEEREDAVAARNGVEQLGAWRRKLVGPDRGVRRGPYRIQTVIRDLAADEDPRAGSVPARDPAPD